MLVSESLARRNWPGRSPLGATVRYFGREWSVVGVVGDVGSFGVTARAVAARRGELGVRTALGARSHELVRLVMRDGVGSAVGGTSLGLVGAYWLSTLLGRLLYEVEVHDPLVFGAAALVAFAVGVLAAYAAAARGSATAARNPLSVLGEN